MVPGHMNLTRKAIAERIKEIEVVLEVLDARLPGFSAAGQQRGGGAGRYSRYTVAEGGQSCIS
jgi:hypothetical protein